MLLEVQDLHVFYGKIEAIKGISFNVNEGEIVSLIGANGAGKTTTMRTISGVRPVAQGRILFEGQDITNMAPHDRVKLGICQAPEGRGIFPGMTVRENLDMGTYIRGYKSATKAADMEHVLSLFPRLGERISEGISVLMVEQNATQALKTAHRGYVLETGYVMKTGTGADLLVDPAVRAAYLGG